MKSTLLTVGATLACVGAVAALSAAPAGPNVHELMKNVIAIQTQVIWDVGNQAQNDEGDPDPTKLKAADWTKAAAAAGKVRQAAESLASAPSVMAAAPGQKIEGEGGPSGGFGAKQVQAAIDANPKVFQAFARALVVSMSEVETAAKTKNAAKLFDVSGRLDQVCEECHVKFWYPDQQAPK